MAYFNLRNAKIKAVAASVPDDVEYTTDYNDLLARSMSENSLCLQAFSAALQPID